MANRGGIKIVSKRSKMEEEYEDYLFLLQKAKIVRIFTYEKLTFTIGINNTNKSGNKVNLEYNPDFLVHYKNRVEIVEVKGYPVLNIAGLRPLLKFKPVKRLYGAAIGEMRERGVNKFKAAALIHKDENFSGIDPVYWRLVTKEGKNWKTLMLCHKGEALTKEEIFYETY